MAILGAHMSIAGGLYKAVERAHAAGCQCVQLFTKNNNQWKAKPIPPEDADRFIQALAEKDISHPIAHNSYLINLASPDRELWHKSIDAMVEELHRADQLNIPYVVSHPGAYTSSDEKTGLQRIARALDAIHEQTEQFKARCLLETTAGQGTTLGWRFEQLAAIFDMVADADRLGICFDTSHVFAAGYAFTTAGEYRAMMQEFDATIGLARLKAFHFNDSLRPLGSRVDRHAHIGQGEMGTEPFRRLLNDRRLSGVPIYLETPKEHRDGRDMDQVNLSVLRELIKVKGRK